MTQQQSRIKTLVCSPHNTQKSHHNNNTTMSAFAYAAPPAAAVFDHDDGDNMVGEVSGTVGVVTAVIDDESSDDNSGEDDDSGDDGEVDDGDETIDAVLFRSAKEIMNRTGRKVGTAGREDRRFREHFGAPFAIVRKVWGMLVEGNLVPEKSSPKHLLWTLYFLKCYPKEGPGCAAVGGAKGAIDPKTMRKWVWLFLERICELADEVVSFFS